jgi:hypothetical protein
MIKWNDFTLSGKDYPLSHLWPEIWTYTQAPKGDKPGINYNIRVIYSLHCFTKKIAIGDDENLKYSDDRETRTFCFDRYKSSLLLPEIIKRLGEGYVYNTDRQNFMRISDGILKGYEVYFTALKSKEPTVDIQLYISSAYLRTRGYSPKAGKIRFSVIAKKIKNNEKIKVHRR